MLDFHRVFVHHHDSLWVGVAWMARQRELTPGEEYVTLPVARPGEVCVTLPDRRILCDFGPEHDHG